MNQILGKNLKKINLLFPKKKFGKKIILIKRK